MAREFPVAVIEAGCKQMLIQYSHLTDVALKILSCFPQLTLETVKYGTATFTFRRLADAQQPGRVEDVHAAVGARSKARDRKPRGRQRPAEPVSYTHLTLPTILRV